MIGYIVTRKHGTATIHNLIVAEKQLFNGKWEYVVVNIPNKYNQDIFKWIPKQHRHIVSLTKPCQPIAQVDALFRNISLIAKWQRIYRDALPQLDVVYSHATYHNGHDDLVAGVNLIDGDSMANMQAKAMLRRLGCEQRQLHLDVVRAVNDYMAMRTLA